MTHRTLANRPIIIGVGQVVNRARDLSEAKTPLDLATAAVKRAEEDTLRIDLAQKIDCLYLVNSLSWESESPQSELARKIEARPKETAYTWIGASAPQWFVNRMGQKLASGDIRLGLICGTEALHSRKLKIKAGLVQAGGFPISPRKTWMAGDLRDPLTPLELSYGLMAPIHIYPLFENAIRYQAGLSIEQHLNDLGKHGAKMSRVAAENPYAWFQSAKTAKQILAISKENRLISWPYTKLMCSIMEVDQAAALLMTTVETARELGIPPEKWIFLRGSGDASDIWHVTERTNFHSSPSVKAAATAAMNQAMISLDDIDYFDLYSCFPSAMRMTRNMLNIAKGDPRQLTITGSMPYFGGPGNNYSLHAICSMVDLLRSNPGKIGLVQALSWFISKHAVGIYSREAGTDPMLAVQGEKPILISDPDWQEPCQLVEKAVGSAKVETFCLFHDRSGEPTGGVVIGKTDEGNRFLAKTEPDKDLMTEMTKAEFVGKTGTIRYDGEFNTIYF